MQWPRDGDPACNTLSWRCGRLASRGKYYLARAEYRKIHPKPVRSYGELNEDAMSLWAEPLPATELLWPEEPAKKRYLLMVHGIVIRKAGNCRMRRKR